MDLKDIAGDYYPCDICDVFKYRHNDWYHDFIPARIEDVLNLDALKDSPIKDIANRLKAM